MSHQVSAVREEVGEAEDQRKLGEFRRMNADRANRERSPETLFGWNSRDQDEDEKGD